MSTEQDEKNPLKQMIENVLKITFQRLDKIYSGNSNDTNVIFPMKRVKSDTNNNSEEKDNNVSSKHIKRVSEQEMRFIFTEVFRDKKYGSEYSYSVETPTKFLYRFSKCKFDNCKTKKCKPCNNNCENCDNIKECESYKKWHNYTTKDYPRICCDTEEATLDTNNEINSKYQCNNGDTANFDLVIHKKPTTGENEPERLAWIEFKAGNPSVYDIAKDYLKLAYEAKAETETGIAYFVHLLTACNNNTIANIQGKLFTQNDTEAQTDTVDSILKNNGIDTYNITHIIHVLPTKKTLIFNNKENRFIPWCGCENTFCLKLNPDESPSEDSGK